MSTNLEALVAKGRRVQHPREQREVAFGLADLSTRSDMHESLVKKGGVKTIVGLLTQSRDEEAQRFAALALANVSVADLYRMQIAKESNALERVILYLQNEEADGIGRQYCAMAIGNLAADPENHASIAEFGGIQALVAILVTAAKDQSVLTGRYAAFALSNLAASANHRKEIADRGAIEPLIVFACSEDISVQRQALAALRGLCIGRQYRAAVVRLGILDPLILMARSDEVELRREVASTLNCLSSMEENKEEVADRAISTIVALLLSNDAMVEQHACCAIANLVETVDIHPRFLQERGLAPVVAISKSSTAKCKAEACRALANLAANANVQQELAKEGVIGTMIDALQEDDVNCQRYSALCIANLATTIAGQVEIVQGNAIKPLALLLGRASNHAEARKYAALALANLSATQANHFSIIAGGGLAALFSLSNSSDALSLYYVGCSLANLSSDVSNHDKIVEAGGIQPAIALAYSKDPDVYQQAAAALRGLSVTGNIKQKIVQEGGLEPVSRMLLSENVDILRDVTACLCNLSLSDENKCEIAKCGAIPPLLAHMQSEDMLVASQSSACVANLAEICENQDLIARDSGILPCISVMRSRHLEVQRESGRLLANLCACTVPSHINSIMNGGGHSMLLSFLLSDDVGCQRVGAFGLGNLCSHDEHRVTLMKVGIFEPLSSLARSEDTELEIRQFTILAIANMASSVENHLDLVADGVLPMLVSLSNSSDAGVRHFSAFAVSRLAMNSDFRQVVTDEGGLEPVLYLARTDDQQVQRALLPAIANLSFVDANKVDICINGGLPALVADVLTLPHEHASDADGGDNADVDRSRLACCAIANLAEVIENMPLIVESNAIPLLVDALAVKNVNVQREAARSLANLAANIDNGALILQQEGTLSKLAICMQSRQVECKRMAALAICNLASNVKFHGDILQEPGILESISEELRAMLDPKCQSDTDTTRFTLLVLANLSVRSENHALLCGRYLDDIIAYCQCGDVKCRYYALFVLGNVCADSDSIPTIVKSGGLKSLVSFAFPLGALESTNAQYQAIAGLRGLATNDASRKEIMRQGGLEPLIFAANTSSTKEGFDLQVQREAASTLGNLALSSDAKLMMCQQGVIPALISLITSRDPVNQVHSIAALGNLAESGGVIQKRLLEEGCLGPLLELVDSGEDETSAIASADVRAEVSRCLSILACYPQSHEVLTTCSSLSKIIRLAASKHIASQRFAALAVANLAFASSNHPLLLHAGAVRALLPMAVSLDPETCRSVALALYNIFLNKDNHRVSENGAEFIQALVTLLHFGDADTNLRACLATKHVCSTPRARTQFVEAGGIKPLLKLIGKSDNNAVELKREVCAALRNVSLSSKGKVAIATDGGLYSLVELCRSSDDDETLHQACGVIANLAEASSNRERMVRRDGILQHLKFVMKSDTSNTASVREAVRAIANLSSDVAYAVEIAGSGALIPLVEALSSSDFLCQRFAAMSISNLAAKAANQERIVSEGGVRPLLDIIRSTPDPDDNDVDVDVDSRRYAFSALANLTGCRSCHATLMEAGLFQHAASCLTSDDASICSSAVLSIANLASNRSNHDAIIQDHHRCLDHLFDLLSCSQKATQLWTIKALRGMASNPSLRDVIVDHQSALETILELCKINDEEVQAEVLATLCNLSRGGHLGALSDKVLESVDTSSLVSFLCSDKSTYRLFGAIALGNTAVDTDLHGELVDGGAIDALLEEAADNKSSADSADDKERRRCLAYALCNLLSHQANCQAIVDGGGLDLIISSLCLSGGDSIDSTSGLVTIRSIAASDRHRRALVLAGALDAISLGLKSLSSQSILISSTWEASAAMYSLSLHEQNKVSLVESGTVKDALRLLVPDTNLPLLRQITRTVANCCENQSLIKAIALSFDIGTSLLGLLKLQDLELSREVARMIANMSSCTSTHKDMLSSAIPEKVVRLCQSADSFTSQYALVGVLNLVVKQARNQLRLLEAGASKILVAVVMEITGRIKSMTKAEITADQSSDLQRLKYSCLALGALSVCPGHHRRLLDDGFIPAVIGVLELGDTEALVCAGFALNMLARNQENFALVADSGASAALVKVVHTAKSPAASQALVALRFLGRDDTVQLEIGRNGGFDALSRASELKMVGMGREVASCLCALAQNAINKNAIAKSSALDVLLSLVHSTDAETARFGLASLANIAEEDDGATHRILLGDKNILPVLLLLMKNKNTAICREATRATTNLLATSSYHGQFLDMQGLDSLNVAARVKDKECMYSVALAYRKLAAHASNQVLLMDASMQTIIAILLSGCEARTKRQAAIALREIASNEDLIISFVGNGGLKATTMLLRGDDMSLKITAAEILRHLSFSSRLKTLMLERHVPSCLFACVETTSDVDFLFQCAATIANLVESEKNGIVMVEQGLLRILVLLLASTTNQEDDAGIKVNVARTMCSLSYVDTNHSAMLEESCMAALLDLLSCECEEATALASLAVGNLAATHQGRRIAGEAGGVAPLIHLLPSPSPSCQKATCRSLCRLAAADTNRRRIVNEGALPQLVRKLSESSDDDELRYLAAMVLCNILHSVSNHERAIDFGCLPPLAGMLECTSALCKRYSAMSLCNLSLSCCYHETIAQQERAPLSSLVKLIAEGKQYDDDDVQSMEYATLTLNNLAAARHHQPISSILAETKTRAVSHLVAMTSSSELNLKRASALALYSFSTKDVHHGPLVADGATAALFALCSNQDAECRCSAIRAMCNLSASPTTRTEVTKGGGLQVAIRLLGDEDEDCRDYACLCLANMCNSANTQEQVVVHGALGHLKRLALGGSSTAIMSLVNAFVNEANHERILDQEDGPFAALLRLSRSCHEMAELCAYGVSNLASSGSPKTLRLIGRGGGIELLIHLANTSISPHGKCLAIAAMNRLAIVPENRDGLVQAGILAILSTEAKGRWSNEVDIQREVALSLVELTQSPNLRCAVVDACCDLLFSLITSNDAKTAAQSVGAMANAAEESELHGALMDAGAPRSLSALLLLEDTSKDVLREIIRATSNLVSTKSCQDGFIQCGLYGIIDAVSKTKDKDCLRNVALTLRKLSFNASSHAPIVHEGISALHFLIQSTDVITCTNAATTLHNICANETYKPKIIQLGSISELINLSRRSEIELKQLAMASLRHLSTTNNANNTNETLRRTVIEKGTLVPAIQCISTPDEDLHRHVAGLFACLSECSDHRVKLVSGGIIPALIALSRGSKNIDTKQSCSWSLANLCADKQVQFTIYRQGGLDCLLDLLQAYEKEGNQHVAIGLKLLASNPKVGKAISSNEGVLGQILAMSKHDFLDYQRSATSILGSLTLNNDFRLLLAKRDGALEDVLSLLAHSDLYVQRNACYTIANVAEASTLRAGLIQRNALQALGIMGPANDDVRVIRDISRALSCLSTNDDARKIIVHQSHIFKRLLKFSRSADSTTQRYSALSMCNVCLGLLPQKSDIFALGAYKALIFLARFPDLEVERCAALALAALSLGCDKSKVRMVQDGVVRRLIKMLKFPDLEIHHCSSLAINSIILGTEPATKHAIFKEEGLEPFLTLVKGSNDDVVYGGIYTLGLLAENDYKIAPASLQMVVKKIEGASLEIKRAGGYLLALLASNSDNHEMLEMAGGLKCMVGLASFYDNECQEYGAFCLAHLSRNDAFRVELVKELEAVPSLVAIMNSAEVNEARSYAALALLNMAEDYETHLVMAESGAIQGLLNLSADQSGLQYQASKASAKLAASLIQTPSNL